jgi:hypothetical protein
MWVPRLSLTGDFGFGLSGRERRGKEWRIYKTGVDCWFRFLSPTVDAFLKIESRESGYVLLSLNIDTRLISM